MNPSDRAIRIVYQDAMQFDLISRSLTALWNHAELNRQFQMATHDLREKLSYDTQELEEELQRVFDEQKKRINDRILKTFQEGLNGARDFMELSRIHAEIQEKRTEVAFSDDQQFLLREMFEFHRSRVRDRYLDTIYQRINAVESRKALMAYWNELKFELFSYRSSVGKEYESLIARFIDDKLQTLEV